MSWQPTHPILWQLLFPIRFGVKKNPTAYFSGLAVRFLLKPLIPKTGTYVVDLPIQGKIHLHYDDSIGLSSILHGFFEEAELRFVHNHIKKNDTVIDVGAHVGLFTVSMGYAVGPQGKVLSIEPVQSNVEQLKNNLVLNEIKNVSIISAVAGEKIGSATINLTDDLAFSTIHTPWAGHTTVKKINVSLKTLDHIWEQNNSPFVSFIKIDVEGAEVSVLKGASKLLRTCKPTILIEANEKNNLELLSKILSPLGYEIKQPPKFAQWNYIFQRKI